MRLEYNEAAARWRCAQAMEIRRVPAVLQPQVSQRLLAMCAYEGVSVELMIACEAVGASAVGRLRLFLLFRDSAIKKEALENRTPSIVQRVMQHLVGAGFDAQILEHEGEQGLSQLLSQLPWNDAAMYFHAETAGRCYAPADASQINAVPLAEITELLVRQPGSAFVLQLTRANLVGEEKALIAQNLAYFEQQAGSLGREGEDCVNAFRRLQGMADQSLYFLSIAWLGQQQAQSGVVELMHRYAMTCVPLGPSWIESTEYVLDGAARLSEVVAEQGHASCYAQRLDWGLKRLSHLLSEQEAGNLLLLPRQGRQLFGVAVSDVLRDHQPLPEAMLQPDGLYLGERIGGGEKVYLPYRELVRHGVVVGMPGSGKTTFALGMLVGLHRQGMPFLAIEPTKCEYRALVDVIPELRVYTPGRSDVSPVSLNPFLPPEGVTLEQYLPCLTNIFGAAFSMTHPLDVIFPDVLRACYTRYGWRNQSTRSSPGAKRFGLSEFIAMFREHVDRSGYDPESKANLLSGGTYRLQALLNNNPALYDTDNTLPYERLLDQSTLIELDALDNVEQKSLVMMLLLTNLMLVIRQKQVSDGGLKNVIMMDEAHLLLGQHRSAVNGEGGADPMGQALQMIQNMVAVIRAYGTAMIFADQSPEKLTREVVDNANVKLMFRLDSERDRALLAGSVGMTQGVSNAIRTLPPGEAFVSCNLLDRPVRVKTPETKRVLSLRDRVEDKEIVGRMGFDGALEKPFAACDQCAACAQGCSLSYRQEADFLARVILDQVGPALVDREKVKRFMREDLEKMMAKALEEYAPDIADPKRLTDCLRLTLKRRLLIVGPSGLRREDLEKRRDRHAQVSQLHQ